MQSVPELKQTNIQYIMLSNYCNGNVSHVNKRHNCYYISVLLKCLYQHRKVAGYVYVLRESILPHCTILIFDFGIDPTVWYFLFFILLLRLDDRTVPTVCYFLFF